MQEQNLINYQVWNLKRVALAYYLNTHVPQYNFQKWIHYYVSGANTTIIEKEFDAEQSSTLSRILESFSFKMFISIFEADHQSKTPNRQEKLRSSFGVITNRYNKNLTLESVIEKIIQGQKQEALQELDDIEMSNKLMRELVQHINREEQEYKIQSQCSRLPTYSLEKIISQLKDYILGEVNNRRLSKQIQKSVKLLESLPIKEQLQALLKANSSLQDQNQDLNLQARKDNLLIELILATHQIVSHFTEYATCMVRYGQVRRRYSKGYLLELIKLQMSILSQQLNSYMFLSGDSPNYYLVATQFLEVSALLVESKKISLSFQNRQIEAFLPLSIPLSQCKEIFKQELQINDQIEIEIQENGKTKFMQEVKISQLSPLQYVYVSQFVAFQVTIDNQKEPIQLTARGDKTIRQIKEIFEGLINIPRGKQVWKQHQNEIDQEWLYQLKNGDEIIQINVTQIRNLQYYGFTKTLSISFESFKRFTFDDDQYFLDKIQQQQAIKFPDQKYEETFRRLCLGYFFSSIKKHSLISHSINHIQSLVGSLQSQISRVKLWKPAEFSENYINQFNDTFLIYHLLSSAEQKLKIELLRQLKVYYPVPFLMKQNGKPNILYEEHYWIHNKAFNIVSLSFKDDKIEGKSTLLNYLFNTNFQQRQDLHRDCIGNIEIAFNVLQSDQNYINIFDVCNSIEESIKVNVINACNFILIHSKVEDEKDCSVREHEIITWLEYNQINIPFIILFRDMNPGVYDNYQPETKEPSFTPKYKTPFADFPMVHITDSSMKYYSPVYEQISKSIHELIKVQYIQAEQELWKFSDFLASKSSPNLERLNTILKEIDNEQESLSSIINIEEEVYSHHQDHSNQIVDKQIREKALKFGLTNLLKKFISYCKFNSEYIGQIIKKLKDFLLLKKSQLCKDFHEVEAMVLSNAQISYDLDEVQKKLSLSQGKIINSKMSIISTKAKVQLQKQFQQFDLTNLKTHEIPRQLKSLKGYFYQQIHARIFSIELFWRQLISMYKFNKNYQFSIDGCAIKLEDELVRLGKKLIIESEAFELINGDLLDLPKEFLNKIFEGFEEKGVMVIGIVGPQSSGKSTLLNFVLGCDFMSSLGRCTKGVYGTYYEITNKEEANFDSILVLDTEGLMSNYENPHYANRNNFDLKLLLFCMKICDIVIFNNRGEFTRQCKPLLQQTFDPQLSNSERLPDVYFVINMNLGDGDTKQIIQFGQFCEYLRTNSKLAEHCLHSQNILTLPCAFNEQHISFASTDFKTKKIPKQEYIKKTITFNKLIQRALIQRSSQQNYKVRNLETLITEINQRWHTLNHYPLLTKFTDKMIKNLSSVIQEWENKVEDELMTYLQIRKRHFEERFTSHHRLENLLTINLQKQKDFQTEQFQRRVEEKKNDFHTQFQASQASSKIQIQQFLDVRKIQAFQFFMMKKKIIEEFFKEHEQKMAIQIAERDRKKQLQQLITSCLSQLKEGTTTDHEERVKFHQYWIKNNKNDFEMTIDRSVIANDLYQRYLKIYKKYLNKEYETSQKYEINPHYKFPVEMSLEEYVNEISNLFQSKFTSQDKIFEFNNKEPVFSVGNNQGGVFSSQFQYLNMNDFYKIEPVQKYLRIDGEVITRALKRWTLYNYVDEKLSISEQSTEFLSNLVIDFQILGLNFSLIELRNFIHEKLFQKFWNKSSKDQEISLKIFKKHLQILHHQNSDIQYFSSKKKSLKHRFLKSSTVNTAIVSKFYYNTQFILITQAALQKLKIKLFKDSQLKKNISDFQTNRSIFFREMKVLSQTFYEKNIGLFKKYQHRFTTPEIIQHIVEELIINYLDNLDTYNSEFQNFLEQFSLQTKRMIIYDLNKDLKKINLQIMAECGFFQNIKLQRYGNSQIKFNSLENLRGVLKSFGQSWNVLKNADISLQSKIGKDSICIVTVNEISPLSDGSCLEKYKQKVIEQFKQNVNKRQFLDFVFQHLKQNKTFQRIMDKITQIIQEAEADFQLQIVGKIQKIIKEVSLILKEFNDDLRQVCQKLLYDFQIELHSWAFHYFWKVKQLARWNLIKKQIQRSNLEQDEQKSYQEFKAKISHSPQVVNEKYAFEFANKYKNYITHQLISNKNRLTQNLLLKYHEKTKNQFSITKVDEKIVEILLDRIQTKNQLALNEQLQLTENTVNYFTKKRSVLLEHYENTLKSEIVGQFKCNLEEKIIVNVQLALKEMKNCLEQLVSRIFNQPSLGSKEMTPAACNQTLQKLLLGKDDQRLTQPLKWVINKVFINNQLKTVNFTNIILFVNYAVVKISKIIQNCDFIELGQWCTNFRELLKTEICRHGCPCCKNICINQDPRHNTHNCNVHYYRAIGNISIKVGREIPKFYPSYFRCDEIKNEDVFEYDSEKVTWEQFKRKRSDWSFEGKNSDWWTSALRKLWSVAGEQICRRNKLDYMPEHQKVAGIQVDYIFALDESGSMQGLKWTRLKDAVDGHLTQIRNDFKQSLISILTFNNTVDPVILDKLPQQINLKSLKRKGGWTSYGPVFRKIHQLAQQKRDQHVAVIFVTDGVAQYPAAQVQLLKQLKMQKEQLSILKLKLIFITIFISDDHNHAVPDELRMIKEKLGGQYEEIRQMFQLKSKLRQVQFKISSRLRASMESVRSFSSNY